MFEAFRPRTTTLSKSLVRAYESPSKGIHEPVIATKAILWLVIEAFRPRSKWLFEAFRPRTTTLLPKRAYESPSKGIHEPVIATRRPTFLTEEALIGSLSRPKAEIQVVVRGRRPKNYHPFTSFSFKKPKLRTRAHAQLLGPIGFQKRATAKHSSFVGLKTSHSWATDRLLEGFGSKSALSLSTAHFWAKNSKSRAKQFGSNRPKMGPHCTRSYEVLLEHFEGKSALSLSTARFEAKNSKFWGQTIWTKMTQNGILPQNGQNSCFKAKMP